MTAVLVVDAANVVGSRPDGWWKDRVGAARRLLAELAEAHARGTGLADRVVVVLEGQATAADDVPGLEVVRAARDGDSTIVDVVRELTDARRTGIPAAGSGPGPDVVVVTSDRELARRVQEHGAQVHGTRRLRDVLDAR